MWVSTKRWHIYNQITGMKQDKKEMKARIYVLGLHIE